MSTLILQASGMMPTSSKLFIKSLIQEPLTEGLLCAQHSPRSWGVSMDVSETNLPS